MFSHALNKCASMGVVTRPGAMLLLITHCVLTGPRNCAVGTALNRRDPCSESPWMEGSPHLNVGIEESFQKTEYTARMAGVQTNAAFLFRVQGVRSVCRSDSWEGGGENHYKIEQRK